MDCFPPSFQPMEFRAVTCNLQPFLMQLFEVRETGMQRLQIRECFRWQTWEETEGYGWLQPKDILDKGALVRFDQESQT